MRYLDINSLASAVSWDKYFEYLKTVEHRFPPSLRRYVMDWGHCSLQGANTLHDAWLAGVAFLHDPPELTLDFLGAFHDRRHLFRYVGVKEYTFDIKAEFRHGDRDVLAQEFRIEDDGFTHEILFANRGRILVRASDIVTEIGAPLT
jgi:hypothetical protein